MGIVSNFMKLILKNRIEKTKSFKGVPIIFVRNFKSGVCLGDLIILDTTYKNNKFCQYHEYGHHLQWKRLKYKPLYWFKIGIPSFCRNIYDRIAHRKWTSQKRKDWYYKGFPEYEANKLAGISYSYENGWRYE